MEEKREPKNDKFITGKMTDYIGKKFDVFLGRNMSIFRCDDFLFIKPPYTGVINGNFSENNHLQSKYGPLNSFFIDKKSEILSFYPINCEIEITNNDNKKTFKFIKEKNTTSSKDTEIMITHPTFTQTKINKEYLVIDDTTTIADIFKQLNVEKMTPFEYANCCCGFSLNDIKNNLCCCLT